MTCPRPRGEELRTIEWEVGDSPIDLSPYPHPSNMIVRFGVLAAV